MHHSGLACSELITHSTCIQSSLDKSQLVQTPAPSGEWDLVKVADLLIAISIIDGQCRVGLSIETDMSHFSETHCRAFNKIQQDCHLKATSHRWHVDKEVIVLYRTNRVIRQ